MSNANDFIIENGVLTKYVGPGGDVIVPDGVHTIGEQAFYKNTAVTSVTLPASVTTLKKECFWGCRGITSIDLQDNIISIEKDVFSYCVNLERLQIPNQVVTDRFDSVLHDCWDLRELILPAGVTTPNVSSKYSSGCLYLDVCNKLTTLVCPGIPLEAIREKRIFAAVMGFIQYRDKYCNKEIADGYIQYVRKRKKVFREEILKRDLVSGLQLLAENGMITAKTFEADYFQPAVSCEAKDCVAYLLDWKNKNISFADVEKHAERELLKDPYNVTDMKKVWSFTPLEDGTLMITNYKGGETNVIVPERIGKKLVTRLDDNTFSVTKKKSWREKPESQVNALRSIVSVKIPESVTDIGEELFYGCRNLANVEIPNGVTRIGYKAFSGCSSLTNIVLPDSVNYIGSCAFYGCRSLTNIVIPDGVTFIGNEAFRDCQSLISIVIPDSVTIIGFKAFSYCHNLASIAIPDSVTNIGWEVFRESNKLSNAEGFFIDRGILHNYSGAGGDVAIPAGITSVGGGAFYECENLTSVTIPEGVTSIGQYAFSHCKSLTNVVIPDSVTGIEPFAFSYCDRVSICGRAGSYAETYAKENNIPFVAE